jgi:lipoic acid synthetase
VSRHPEWIRVRAPSPSEADGIRDMRDLLQRHHLSTVCQGAICPNAVECWSARTATFMLLGDLCTRACRFCGVTTGDPRGIVDRDEPERLAAAVAELGLRYVVLTSVDRDDLPDGGAALFAASVDRLKAMVGGIRAEVLIPDFQGDRSALDRLLATGADVFGHNVETVRRLTPGLRDRRAGYEQSLAVLAVLSKRGEKRKVKSGLMVGLGETRREIIETFTDLRDVGVDIVTIGQYLRPGGRTVPVERHVPPAEFDEIAAAAEALGFGAVVAGPLVRSSYHALKAYAESCAS